MKFAKTAFFTLGLFFASAVNMFAFEAKDILTSSVYNELKNGGNLKKVYYKQGNADLSLVPNAPLTKAATKHWSGEQEPVFVEEILYLVPKNQIGSGDVSKVTIDKTSQILRNVSSWQGIQYYSSRKKWETLYKEAYTIKGPKDRTKIADDLAGDADGKTIYCYQNDNSFGKIIYQIDYKQNENEVTAVFTNASSIYVGPIKGVGENNLKISVSIVDCGSDIVVYLLVKANFPAMSLVEKKMQESLTSRLEALYRWMISKY